MSPARLRAARVAFFLLGVVLLYAPPALLVRLLLRAVESPLHADAHRVCLRMPFEWLSQPWMWRSLFGSPLNLVALLLLPAVALAFGPLFCGWLCPAGVFPELASRLVPRRLQLRLGGRIDPTPIRYGVLVGMLLAPFTGAYLCCSFCNFAMMQSLVNAAFGDPAGLTAWASFTIVTFALWLLVLGLFTEGGRGWCNLICPAGAAQGLAHALGSRLRGARALRRDPARCRGCGDCATACPAWALDARGSVNLHACNGCLECVPRCPEGALRYGLARRDRPPSPEAG